MEDKQTLMMPGPTPVPESVLLAQARHPVGHRSSEFSEVVAEITEHLNWLHQTQNNVIHLAASGTGAMEAGTINFLSPGDHVLVGCNGKFSERWADMAEAFGLNVERISAPWGQPLDPEQFRAPLEADTDKTIKAVIVTHSETSTGALTDLQAINRHVRNHGEALTIVDAVTSLGAIDLPVDAWDLDVVVSGSQKGYMVPPGLGFVAVSDRAWRAYERAQLPRYYLDLGMYRKALDKNSTPFTPPINLMAGLQVALRMMRAEGLESIFARHQRATKAMREGVRALGLSLLAPDSAASPAVTAVAPQKVDPERVRAIMKQQFDIALAGGQNQLKGKIFRIGHLGFVSERDLLATLSCLEVTLRELGQDDFAPGAGVAAASQVLGQS